MHKDRNMPWYTQDKIGKYQQIHGEFHPKHLGITDEKTVVVLLRIACRVCEIEFLVAVGSNDKIDFGPSAPGQSFEESMVSMLCIAGAPLFSCGNPPYHYIPPRMCPGTMTEWRPIRIEQFWQRDDKGEWLRIYDFEIDFKDPSDPEKIHIPAEYAYTKKTAREALKWFVKHYYPELTIKGLSLSVHRGLFCHNGKICFGGTRPSSELNLFELWDALKKFKVLETEKEG